MNVRSNLPEVLDDLHDWSIRNKMQLNPSKCQMLDICFSRVKPVPSSLCLNDITIKHSNIVKLLGIYIQSDLKWDAQVNSMVRRSNSCLFMLRKLKHFHLTTKDLVTDFISFVRPVVEYAVPVWTSRITSKHSEDIERVQKRACKISLGLEYDSYRNALQILELDTLQECRQKSVQVVCKIHT